MKPTKGELADAKAFSFDENGIIKPTEEELAYAKAFVVNEPSEKKEELGTSKGYYGEEGYSNIQQRWHRPTLEVVGMSGGYTSETIRSTIATSASAKISCRLVPGQDPDDIVTKIMMYVGTLAPFQAVVETTQVAGSARAWTSSRHSKGNKAAQQVLKMVFSYAPKYMKSGDSIPALAIIEDALNIPSTVFGFGLGDHTHTNDERLSSRMYKTGLKAWTRMLWELGNPGYHEAEASIGHAAAATEESPPTEEVGEDKPDSRFTAHSGASVKKAAEASIGHAADATDGLPPIEEVGEEQPDSRFTAHSGASVKKAAEASIGHAADATDGLTPTEEVGEDKPDSRFTAHSGASVKKAAEASIGHAADATDGLTPTEEVGEDKPDSRFTAHSGASVKKAAEASIGNTAAATDGLPPTEEVGEDKLDSRFTAHSGASAKKVEASIGHAAESGPAAATEELLPTEEVSEDKLESRFTAHYGEAETSIGHAVESGPAAATEESPPTEEVGEDKPDSRFTAHSGDSAKYVVSKEES
eukprot:gene15495-21580_t